MPATMTIDSDGDDDTHHRSKVLTQQAAAAAAAAAAAVYVSRCSRGSFHRRAQVVQPDSEMLAYFDDEPQPYLIPGLLVADYEDQREAQHGIRVTQNKV
jgi:hypothetical protein